MPITSLLDSRGEADGSDAAHPHLRAFSRMTDSELKDPKQMLGLALALRHAGTDDAAEAGESAHVAHSLESGLFIAESRNVIERALASGARCFALFTEERWAAQAETQALIGRLLAQEPTLPVFAATPELRKRITGLQTTRGPLAAFHRPALPEPQELLANARRVAVLEDITNYTNIGAIFRSAAALGIDAVLVTPGCHDPLYRRAARVSMGAVFQVPWGYIGGGTGEGISEGARESERTSGGKRTGAGEAACANGSERGSEGASNWTREGIPLLRAAGFKTAALALSDDSLPLQDKRLQQCEKLALVLGTEGDGLAARTIAACDFTVRIPMSHGVDSLNVAAASAVAFWELRTTHRN